MVFSSRIHAPFLAIVLAAAVSASPATSNSSPEIANRDTPGDVYVCTQTNWGGDCEVINAGNWCNSVSGWEYKIQSIGPDQGATCYGYANTKCTGNSWTFTHPGKATSGDWSSAIGSIFCDVNGGGSSGGGGSRGSASGIATYYYPNGGTGACGWTIQNGDMSVAIGSGNWDNGAHCGATMTVTYEGKTIQATVADMCPGCQGSNGIDLTQGAMASMDPNWYNNGEDSVTWSVSY